MAESDRSIPSPHPVAALLTEEMRERVRGAAFERDHNGCIREAGFLTRCPLAVALDLLSSDISGILRVLGEVDGPARQFMHLADYGRLAPEDVKPLLGVTE